MDTSFIREEIPLYKCSYQNTDEQNHDSFVIVDIPDLEESSPSFEIVFVLVIMMNYYDKS